MCSYDYWNSKISFYAWAIQLLSTHKFTQLVVHFPLDYRFFFVQIKWCFLLFPSNVSSNGSCAMVRGTNHGVRLPDD